MWINLYIQKLWTYGSGNLRVVRCWLNILKCFKVIKRTGLSAVEQAWDLVILKPAPPAFVFRNCETKFQFFDTFDRGFITADKLFELEQLLNVVHRGKELSNMLSNQDFPKTGDHS